MAEKKSYIYEIIVDTKSGTASINGTALALDKLEGKFRSVVAESKKLNDSLKAGTDKTGLAGAAVVELGRTISDSNYGFTAMANNISQLSTLFTTLIVTTGGLTNGLKAMWAAFSGPLGLIVAFQILVAVMEKFAMNAKKSKQAAAELTDEIKAIRDEYKDLLEINQLQLDIAELNGEELDELKAQRKEILILQLQSLDTQMLAYEKELELAKLTGGIKDDWELIEEASRGWTTYITAGMMVMTKVAINDFAEKYGGIFKFLRRAIDVDRGGGTPSDAEAAAQKEAERKISEAKKERLRIQKEIARLQQESSKGGKRGPDGKWLYAPGEGMTDFLQVPSQEEVDKRLKILWTALEIKRRMLEESAKNEKALSDQQKKERELELEHRLMMFEAVGDGLQSLGLLLGKTTQEGKAIAAAGALIDTYGAIAGILKNTARTPLGGIPGYAIAQAIATGLFGLAQVKKIYDVKVPNGGGGGAGAGAVPSDVPIQQPDFNIVGVTRGNQIQRTITDALGKPIRAYVTTKDIRSSGELDRNIVRGATVG